MLVSLPLLGGCSRNSDGLMGGSSANGDSNQDAKPQQQPQKGGAQTQAPYTAPQASVDGQPSAASDRGSADAVAHRSVTQPGAPQGTLKDGQTPTSPSPAPAAHP